MATNGISELIDKARLARDRAYAPYSNFPVGAALMTRDGEIYIGCNVEISSYGLSVCAERVAMFKAISEGVRDFEIMAVTALTESFCPPCGACRQVLMDFAPQLRLVLVNAAGLTKETTIGELLPEAFEPSYLEETRPRQ